MADTLAHIAVVDDEPDLRRAVATYLGRRGCRVTDVPDGAALRTLMARERVDLVVLDINMPGEDGLSVARWLRALPRSALPPVGLVMLTGNDDLADRVVGLELGADDYLTKPFEPRELLARVRSLLRRLGWAEAAGSQAPAAPTAAEAQPDVVTVGRCRYDRRSGEATDMQGRALALTPNERQVLALLVAHPHQPVDRGRLLEVMRDRPLDAFDRAVDSCIARLRRKLEHHPARPRAIRTLHGQGYVYTPDEEG